MASCCVIWMSGGGDVTPVVAFGVSGRLDFAGDGGFTFGADLQTFSLVTEGRGVRRVSGVLGRTPPGCGDLLPSISCSN